MSYVAILAGTTAEANAHVKRHRLPKAGYRYAARAASVRNLRVSEIHILPGFARRFDRHAILAELRYTRGERKVFDEPRGYVDLERAWDLAHAEQERQLNEGRLSYDEALEQAYITMPVRPDIEQYLEPPGWEPPETMTASDILENAAKPNLGAEPVLQGGLF